MRKMADNSISAIVTDSPYGISFMGKDWDHGLPSTEYWREMLRIVKPGGHLLAAGLPRMMHRLISVIEDSGWLIRDLLMHIFGSGFPKSHNHFGIDGYGTALKPAWEGWSLAMKPLDGTFAQNAEKWGQAGINIDGCRIEASDQDKFAKNWDRETIGDMRGGNFKNSIAGGISSYIKAPKGRWPANVIFDEEAGALLDEQSGPCKTGDLNGQPRVENKIYGKCGSTLGNERYYKSDAATGASRFFYCPKASSRERNEGLDGFEIKESIEHSFGRYRCKKCNKLKLDHNPCTCEQPEFERIQVNKNNHPTVKPLKLMEYLIRLVMPPKDGLLLDPFSGSGTTILAAKRLGFNAIGIEKQAEYCDIANARLASCQREKLLEQGQQLFDFDDEEAIGGE